MLTRPRRRAVLVALTLAVLACSGTFGVLIVHPHVGNGAAPAARSSGPLPGPASLSPPSGSTVPRPGVAPSVHGPSPASPAALPRADVFGPNPVAATIDPHTSAIAPSFRSAPAPMGLSDLGVGSNGSYSYRTSSFEGQVTIRSFSAFQPGFVDYPPYQSPDWGLLQLNAVAVNISFPHNTSGGVFWVQNAVHLNRTTLQFEDNIWNFTAVNGPMTPSVVTGTSGHTYRNQFYAGFGPKISVTYPVTIDLFDNVSFVSARDIVHFAYTVVPSVGAPISRTYDVVTFNGTASALTLPQFEVDGAATTPSNQLYDAELVFGGNGGGTNTNIVSLNGTASLREYNPSVPGYVPVRSAYDFGSDSSETALGVAVHYAANQATAYLSAGPSILYGLWNTSSGAIAPAAAPGLLHLQITTVPNYAFVLANLSARGFADSYAPSSAAGVMSADLPPLLNGAPYVFDVYADGYLPGSATVTNNSTASPTVTLISFPTELNAPLYLDGQGQLTALVAAGLSGSSYSAGQHTLWINSTKVKLAPEFRGLNELGNPEFQLFAEQGLTAGVSLNGFVQDPTTFNYTYYGGLPQSYPGWTQGYFFIAGTGAFTVSQTSLAGVPALLGQTIPTFAAPTIEFYLTDRSSARSITVSNDARGVTAFGATSLAVTSVTATASGVGVVAMNLSGLSVSNVGAADATGVWFDAISASTVAQLSATALGLGLNGTNSSDLTVVGLSVGSSATGFLINNTGTSNVSWVNVTGGANSIAGNWSDSVAVNFSHLNIAGTGVTLTGDSVVTVTNGTASGFAFGVVQDYANSTGGVFDGISASAGAIGVNLTNASHSSVQNIVALTGSIGVFVTNSSNISGSVIASYVDSVGVYWSGGQNGNFDQVNTSSDSVGVWAFEVSVLSVSNVTAYNFTLGTLNYSQNPLSVSLLPIAGVALYNDTTVTVRDVVATGYPYGVWSNGTKSLTVETVAGWYDGTVVNVNATQFATASTIESVFSYGSQYGVLLQNSTYVTIQLSTFETSGVLGVLLENGSHDSVKSSNFVGNNNSSVNGVYSAAHVQAWTINSSSDTFSRNYWADHSGSVPYTINNSLRDDAPQSAFLGPYLEFTESGLVAGVQWSIALGSFPIFNSTYSLFYIPGWVLPNTTLLFFVLAPPLPLPSPITGTVPWAGITLSPVHITFGVTPVPPTILGLPVGIFFVLIAVVVVAALVAVYVLFLRKRRPPAPTNPLEPDLP